MDHRIGRRRFLQAGAFAGFGILGSGSSGGAAGRSPNDRLRFACIGVGGKGSSDTDDVARLGDVVGLCDIDANRLAQKAEKIPGAKTYNDFRAMLDELGPKVDAVVVSTPDHTHAAAALRAIRMGKHVYCQKPLAHTPYEARLMREEAVRMKVATQMGNQGTSHPGFRSGIDLIRSGVVGPIREVHVWTNRPFKYWKQAPDLTARPAETPPIPAHVAWDLFLGPAPERPYHPVYHPHDWRGWWDFGTGAMGDMACHTANLAFMALKLGLPAHVSATSAALNPETYPAWATITYDFPARGELPPVKLTWYEGARDGERNLPPSDLFGTGEKPPSSGSLLIGERGSIFSPSDYGSEQRLLPASRFEGRQPSLASPDEQKRQDRELDPSHKAEWARAIREDDPKIALSNFAYSGTLTEAMLLGNVAVRLGRPIDYDAATGTVTNSPEAARFVRPEYRKGWTL